MYPLCMLVLPLLLIAASIGLQLWGAISTREEEPCEPSPESSLPHA